MTTLRLTEDDAERFWAKVDKRGKDECWPWLASFWKTGYGVFRVGKQRTGDRKMVGAHVVAFTLHNGYPPKDGELVRPTCDHRWCCNPYHLIEGSSSDNPWDMVERGLSNAIDPEKVFRLKEAGARQVDIAARLGVHQTYVSLILRGKRRVKGSQARTAV